MNRASVIRFPEPELRSFSVDPKTKEVVIRLYVGDTLGSDVVNVLDALQGLVRHMRMVQESCGRDLKNDEARSQRRKRHVEVARSYQRLRYSGVKHRAAIRALFVDPAFSDLHAASSDIAYWVKVYALQVSK